jgi:SAM-dependent methyltransferase
MDRFQSTRQPDWEWWSRLWPTPGNTLRTLGIGSGDSLAEIGSGNGYFTLPAARITAPAPVYAVDVDASLLEELSHLADQQAIENIRPINGDARTLARQLPEAVGVVLVANIFHGIEDTESFVCQAVESLRPGGRCLIVNWKATPRETTRIAGEPRGPPTELRMSPEETQQRVHDAAALTLKETVELPPYHYAMVFDR